MGIYKLAAKKETKKRSYVSPIIGGLLGAGIGLGAGKKKIADGMLDEAFKATEEALKERGENIDPDTLKKRLFFRGLKEGLLYGGLGAGVGAGLGYLYDKTRDN